MACQFKPYAVVDVETLKQNLNADEHSGIRYNDSSGSRTISEDFSMLDDSKVSLSPSGEFFVLAYKRTLCILTAKWDSHEEDDVKTKFKVTWKGDPCHNGSEQITAVMCLPLIMPNKPSRSASEQIDWTCIVVGFSSGFLRFYDEGGDLLLSEQIYDEPITHLKCQSFHPSKTSTYDDYPEELYVTFRSTVAVIPGFALFQTLRACRNQLARVKANFAEHVAPPPLTLKKWSFVDQDRMRDCEVIGPSSSDMFDHLMTASICGGFNSCYRSGAPKSTLVVAAGKGPFIGFQYALEGVEGRSVLTDVAQVVKSKFKGLFGSRSNDRQKSPAIEPPESLACRFGLCDFNREADKIVRSPNREYSAVTDALGRVTLVNNLRGIAVRMWKGYRKAQCGWLQIEEEEPSSKKSPKHLLRSVLFLVIYDPKKGVLEVWTVPNGIRVAAFSCSKRGRLLYTSHGLVGLNNVAVKWANRSLLPCVFLDPCGTLFQVIVPFHCALSDATSERAADLALLRKLKTVLRETELDEEQLAQEVGLLAAELKTAEVRKQMLALLTSSRHVTVDALEGALGVFFDRASSDDSRSSDGSRQVLLLSIQQLRNLISFYKFVHQQKERPPNYSAVVPQEGVSDLQAVCDVLSVSEREVTAMKSLLALLDSPVSSQSSPKREARVTFTERTSSGSSLVDFLACFDFGKTCKGAVAPHAVGIKKQLVPAKVSSLADLLFQGILYSDIPIEVWQTEAACSAILPSNLLHLAVQFWLHRNVGKALEVEMMRFSEIVKAICMMEEVNTCDLSTLWSMVRVMLAESDQPFNALTAALVCRAVAVSLEKHGLKKHSKSPKKLETCGDTSKDSDVSEGTSSADTSKESSFKAESRNSSTEWEDVSWDSVKWNLLIGRLEDIALLDLIVGQNPADLCDRPENNTVPCLRYEKPNISLYGILHKGKGAISEQVAKWLTSCGVDPKLLIDSSDIERSDKNVGLVNHSLTMDEDNPGPEDKSEEQIREGLPLTAEKGIEAMSVSAPCSQILDKIGLLRRRFPYSLCGSALIANVSWELLLEWQKCPERIDILSAVVTCLQMIPNMHIRQGLSSIMWTSHLKQRVETAAKIVSETNGNPKDKLCRKELQMSESQLTEFVETCLKFIESFIEASNLSEVMHPPGSGSVVNCCEDIWDYDEQISLTSAPSLTALALVQPQASFDHLHLLHQLTATMHMILALGLRGQQLTPIFSPVEWGIFFSDGTYTATKDTRVAPDPQLCNKRAQFLIRAVTGALQGMLASDPSHVTALSDGPCSDMSTAMKWMGKCKDLAYTWQLPMDPIRRHQVFLLYSSGHDRLAEEVMSSVNDVELLASHLLPLCMQRLKLILDGSEDLMDSVSNLDPMLTMWLHELNTSGVRQVSLADTALLSAHIAKYLPEHHPEAPLATDLLEALQALS